MYKVELYSKAFCPFCIRLKFFLKSSKIKYEEIDLDKNPGLRSEMIARTKGPSTVPQLFVNDEYIGDCSFVLSEQGRSKLSEALNRELS